MTDKDDDSKLQVYFAEYRLFYRVLLQKRPVIMRCLLVVATPYRDGGRYGCRDNYLNDLLSDVAHIQVKESCHAHVDKSRPTLELKMNHVSHMNGTSLTAAHISKPHTFCRISPL